MKVKNINDTAGKTCKCGSLRGHWKKFRGPIIDRLMNFFKRIKSKKKKKNEIFDLNLDDVRNNLVTNDEELVNSILEIVKNQQERVRDTTSLIESKASSLFGMVAISISLITALGAIFVDKMALCNFSDSLFQILIGVFFVAICLMVVSNFLALCALEVRSDWRELKDIDIFRSEVIKEGSIVYKRFITTAIWETYMKNYMVNEKKATYLKYSQKMFFYSLIFLPFIIIFLVLYLTSTGGKP